MVVLLNRGLRTWHLKPFVDKDGNSTPRVLKPESSIEALDAAEAKELLGYGPREIIDAEKAIKPVADRIAALTAERDQLLSQVSDLQKKLKKYEKD